MTYNYSYLKKLKFSNKLHVKMVFIIVKFRSGWYFISYGKLSKKMEKWELLYFDHQQTEVEISATIGR